jgi:hypothetical protein
MAAPFDVERVELIKRASSAPGIERRQWAIGLDRAGVWRKTRAGFE